MQFKHLSALALVVLWTATASQSVAHDRDHPDAPSPSPNASVSQIVGYGKVTIDHGRPGVKGREGKIWGELVPYNGGDPRPWSAGANGNAVITFEENVKIEGHDLSAGAYGLMMIPSADTWTIIFSKNSDRRGILEYTPDLDALRITATPEKTEFREWLGYEITKTGDLTARIDLRWEHLRVGFAIETPDHREASDDQSSSEAHSESGHNNE